MSAHFHTVHVRVNDAATGQPTPVRIHFSNSEGEYFAPFGRLTDFLTGRGDDVGGNLQLGNRKFAYIDGTCEIALPTGPLRVEVRKGFEYHPLQQEIIFREGQLALRLSIERWINMRQEGWNSGDTSACFITPHGALLEGAAEDINVVNLLAAYEQHWDGDTPYYPTIPNIMAFSGQRPALELPGHMVVVNTRNWGGVLGQLGLLNCHRIVYPLRFGGGPAQLGGGPDNPLNWTLADWCDQCHRKGGLVIWSTLGSEKGKSYGAERDWLSEGFADLILGKIDAVEEHSMQWCERGHQWYDLLNCGFRVPLVGGSNKTHNRQVLGCIRTYAHLPPGEELTYKNWVEAVRAGRTFATNGPLLSFTVNGLNAGAVIDLPSADQPIRVRATAQSWAAFDRLELVANGVVVASADGAGTPATAILETELTLPEGGWLAARCWGRELLDTSNGSDEFVGAHTSPVYIQIQGRPPRPHAGAIADLADRLERMVAWVNRYARCENYQQRQRLAGIFQSARELLQRRCGS